MRHFDRLRLRLRSLFRRGQVEASLADELEFHLDQQIQENLARGMSPSDARAEAQRMFGGIAQIQQECRDMRRVHLIESLIADVRYAIRGFRRQPGFALFAILTLALGTGASTALFSLVNAVVLRPLPMADADRLFMLWEDSARGRNRHLTPAPANFADWRAQNHTFVDIAAAGWLAFNLTGAGEPERLTGLRVTANYFSVLGVKPAIGRLFAPADDRLQSGHVTVISYPLWQRRFAADPGIVGRTVNLNGQPYTIVGVAPAGFQFPASGAELWIAPGFTQRDLAQRSAHLLLVTGRLKAGVSFEQARADLQTIAKRLETEYPQTNTRLGVDLVPLREYYTGDIRLALKLLLAAVGALLLIVCANLAHLFLARGTARRREIAVRAALGAGRTRVVRQLLTECAVLAFIATLDERPMGANCVVSADYLQVMGIPLLQGRFLDENDGPKAPGVMVINETLARKYWPGENPVGAQVRFGDGGPKQPTYTIVGVAGDVRQMSLDAPPYPEMYFSATQGGPGGSFFWPHVLVVRTAANPLPLAASIRRIIASLDPDQPVASVRTMTDVLDSQSSGRQTQAAIVAMFAICALLLASVGLYGVLSYAVEERRAEIGIRMALGARRGEVVRSVIAQALRWTATGSILGLAGTFALTRAFSSLLFNVSASDPRIFAGFTLLTLGVAVAAGFIPARRAATVDPAVALRQD